jgi:hypothetical protein
VMKSIKSLHHLCGDPAYVGGSGAYAAVFYKTHAGV